MPSLNLVTIFILGILDSFCTIYISSYSMRTNINYPFMIILQGIKATIRISPFSLVVSFPPPLFSFRRSSPLLLPPLPLILLASWLKNNNKSVFLTLLILLHLSPSSIYLIKTLSNSHQQTIYHGSFRLKLSSLAMTSTNLSMALTLVHRPRLALPTRTLQIRIFSLGFARTNCFLVLLLVLFLLP